MRLWVLLLAAALAMAGCAEDAEQAEVQDETSTETNESQTEEPDDEPDEDTPTQGPSDDPEPESNETESNTPPAANLTADATNGTAPLNVTFTVAGHDADGDALAWSLSINGAPVANGSSLPATVTHTLDAGNHTATLLVDDGEETDSAELAVAVAPAGPTEELVATWEGTVNDPTCIIIQGGHSVSEDLWGLEYRVVAGWEDGMFMDFWDAELSSQTGAPDTPIGTIPDGTGNAWLCMGESTGLLNEYTIEIWG